MYIFGIDMPLAEVLFGLLVLNIILTVLLFIELARTRRRFYVWKGLEKKVVEKRKDMTTKEDLKEKKLL